MALRWFQSMFFRESKRFNIYREYCKAISPEQRLKENPYFGKYADKIADVQKISTDEFKHMLDEKIMPPKIKPRSISKDPEKLSASKKVPKFGGQKNLNQIMKLESLENKSASEIESIWKEYHQSEDGLYGVLPKEAYEDMYSRLNEYPVFLFPLPRSEGYEFIMHQFQEHSCYFTSLINYQAFKENAPACLAITYFTELIEKKGIVLMRGEYDDKAINIQEAQCLANQLQLYYGSKEEKKEKLLWTFNKQPETFRHMDLISNFEYSIGK